MRLLPLFPFAILILIGQAALDAMPAVVAEREGGIGLGSALILAQVVQVAAIALGAAAAAYFIDRGRGPIALLVGALLFYAGLFAVGLQPMGALVWVLVAQGTAGAGFGIILTASFAGAAAMEAYLRPVAILLLLLAPLAARGVIGVMYLGGTLALTIAGGIVVALAVLVARLPGVGSTYSSVNATATGDGRAPLSSRGAVFGGLAVGVGVLSTLVGADPSRVSAALLAGSLGMGTFEALDGFRAAMLVGGLALVIGGAGALVVSRRTDRRTFLAVPPIALTAFAAGGMLAALSFATLTGAAVPGERTVSVVGVAAVGGSALGVVLGAAWLARGGRPRVVATAGSALLACTTVVGVVVLRTPFAQPTILASLAVIALIALAGGVAASALRLVLADVAAQQRGLAAAAGVVAASFGSMLGSMIGNGEGVRLIAGEAGATSLGLLALTAAAVVAAGVTWFVTPMEGDGLPLSRGGASATGRR